MMPSVFKPWRWSWAAWIVVLLSVLSFCYVNLCGEIDRTSWETRINHGWPATFLERSFGLGRKLRWPFDDAAIAQFSMLKLLVNIVVAVVVTAGAAIAVDRHLERSRARLSISTLLAALAWMATLCAIQVGQYSQIDILRQTFLYADSYFPNRDDLRPYVDFLAYGTVFFAIGLAWVGWIGTCADCIATQPRSTSDKV